MTDKEELTERMAALLGSTPWEKQPSVVADQIRLARADERRKTLEEEAAYHTKEAASWDRVAESLKAKGKEDAMHQAEGWAAYHESQAERLSETALTNESGEPGETVWHALR